MGIIEQVARAIHGNVRLAWLRGESYPPPAPWSRLSKQDRQDFMDEAMAAIVVLRPYMTHLNECRHRRTGTCNCGLDGLPAKLTKG